MTRILVVALNADLQLRIVGALKGIGQQIATVSHRRDAALLLDNTRQVLIYALQQGDDVGWLANQIEEFPELRVIYFSSQPWVSLNYDRARCLIAPHRPEGLRDHVLQRAVLELLAPDPASF